MVKQRKTGSRFFSLAKMSVTVAKDIASHKAKSLLAGSEDPVSRGQLNHRIGQEVARTLSDMKGPLMKVGQIFAQVKDLLPIEVSEALGQLRQYANPIESEIICEQITKSLGAPPEEVFASFDLTPYRAASLGQVHKATLKTGESVVVKVQYPEVARDCESDLSHLKTLFRLLPLMGVDKTSLELVFLEIEEVIRRELDYVAEVRAINEFREFFADSNRVVVPKAYPEFSSRSIITMSYEQGTSLESVHRVRAEGRGDPEFLQALGENLLFCLAEQIFRLQKIHVDPHAGNFAVKPDGRLVMYDFGAVKELTPDAVELFQSLVEAMLREDTAALEQLLFEKGIRRAGSPALGEAFYQPWLSLFNPPLLKQTYDFRGCTIYQDAMQLAKTNWRKHQSYFMPSRDTLLLDRLIVGHYWNFVHLAYPVSLRACFESYLEYPKHCS